MPPVNPVDFANLLEYDGFVRAVAKSLLFDGHAVDDVVQQTWLAALENGPTHQGRLKAWLARVTRNLSLKRRAGERHRARREERSAAPERVPPVAEILEREALRRTVLEAVIALDPIYRDVMLLRYFEGLPPREIARRLDLPIETVHTRRQRALEQLRARLDHESGGDRHAWCVGLIPLAVPQTAGVAAGTAGSVAVAEFILMASWQAKVCAGLMVCLAAMCGWWWFDGRRSASPDGQPASVVAADSNARVTSTPSSPPTVAATTKVNPVPFSADQEAAPATRAATRLTVRAHFESDGMPAAGIHVFLAEHARPDTDLDRRIGITDADGTVPFDAVTPGAVTVHGDRGGAFVNADVPAGQTVVADLRIPRGVTLRGNVFDTEGEAVRGAEIVLGYSGLGDLWFPVARSDEHGGFELRDIGDYQYLAARAAGYAPSFAVRCPGARGETATIDLLLQGTDAGAIQGHVVDAEGRNVAGALVQVGARRSEARADHPPDAERGDYPPTTRRTDADGRFRIDGLGARTQTVLVRLTGEPAARRDVEVRPSEVETVEIVMRRGWSVQGMVLNESGQALDGVTIRFETNGGLEAQRTASVSDGSFTLRGLPAGKVTLVADGGPRGKVSTELQGAAGDAVRWSPRLSQAQAIRGRVTRDDGEPLPGANVLLRRRAGGADEHVSEMFTDAAGTFAFWELPPGDYVVTVEVLDTELWRRPDLHPSAAPIEVVLPAAELPSACIRGRITYQDGTPAVNASIDVRHPHATGGRWAECDEDQGAFEVRPLAPGDYDLTVTTRDGRVLLLPRRHLAPREVWETGTIVVPGAGEVRFVAETVRGDLTAHVFLPDGRRIRTISSEGGVCRGSLAAGEYVAVIDATGLAPARVPFSVPAQQTTVVNATFAAGILGAVTVAVPERLGERSTELTVCDADGFEVAVSHALADARGVCNFRFLLAPGRYDVTARHLTGATVGGSLVIGATSHASSLALLLDPDGKR